MKRRASGIRGALFGAALASVSACAPSVPIPGTEPAGALVLPPSAASAALRTYYQRVQRSLLSQGLMRTDGGGQDAPFDARRLAEDFIRIAFFEEYTSRNGRIVANETASRLHRWEQPIRMTVEFGPSVDEAHRKADEELIAAYAARLSRITGVPIRMVEAGANYTVLIVNEDERRAIEPRLRALLPGIDPPAVRAVVNMPRSTFCLVLASSAGDTGAYTAAVAVIRAEHPDLMLQSCIHEELAQGMGLPNDNPDVRPSVFNDDEEFALLTRHDELLLKMLYDPRLSVGMTKEEASPIVREIARELMGGQS